MCACAVYLLLTMRKRRGESFFFPWNLILSASRFVIGYVVLKINIFLNFEEKTFSRGFYVKR